MTTVILPRHFIAAACKDSLSELRRHVNQELRTAEFSEEELEFAIESFDDEDGTKLPPLEWGAKLAYSQWLQRWLYQLLVEIDHETDSRCRDVKFPS